MEPSLLDYARFHGIANSFLEIDPFDHVDCSHIDHKDDTLPEAVQSECLNRLNNARVSLEESLYQEKLYIPQRAGHLLASIVRESQAKSPSIDWRETLPVFHRMDDIKLEAPIFPMEDKRKTLCYTSYDIDSQLSKEPFKTTITDATTSITCINADSLSLIEKIRKDKLVCTRSSVALLQHARVSGETPVKELEEKLGRLMEISRVSMQTPSFHAMLISLLESRRILSSPYLLFSSHCAPASSPQAQP
jgi:hypothetical protein